jgi:hypothetical protein
MAFGNTEIITNIQKDNIGGGGYLLPTTVAVCGQCGSIVHPELVAVHAAWENAAWAATAMTTRPARGVGEANAP